MDVLTFSNAEDLMKLSGRHELLKGVICEMSPPGEKHGVTASKIGYIIGKYVYENKLGVTTAAETGYKLSSNPDTVRAPDMAYKSNERIAKGGIAEGYSTVMPELVVEVNSPQDSYGRVLKKVNEWFSAGVMGLIVVDPYEKNVILYENPERYKMFEYNDILDLGEILPGFTCRVSDIFEL
ncbi:MAG: Uma2 family endonuclease [Candidatus Eremiobacterota bacterium]